MIIESCHDLVPPEEMKPIIEKIISNFITEYCQNQHITIGLNTIREVLLRMPLALDESQIEYLVAFRTFRNSSVVSAAKSLVNYFRDVCPQLLPKKFRGRFANVDDDNKKDDMFYGKQKVNFGIDGIELLEKAEGLEPGTLALTRVLNDEDLRKIRLLKLKNAVKHVTKEKMPGEAEEVKESDDDESGEDEDSEEIEDDDEEGEAEMEEDDEEGEDEIEEEVESSEEEESEKEDLDALDSEILEGSSDDENPQGVVYSH